MHPKLVLFFFFPSILQILLKVPYRLCWVLKQSKYVYIFNIIYSTITVTRVIIFKIKVKAQ